MFVSALIIMENQVNDLQVTEQNHTNLKVLGKYITKTYVSSSSPPKNIDEYTQLSTHTNHSLLHLESKCQTETYEFDGRTLNSSEEVSSRYVHEQPRDSGAELKVFVKPLHPHMQTEPTCKHIETR
jgi:hypothetical protein